MVHRLVRYVLKNMANDAASASSARTIVSLAEQGRDLSDIKKVLRDIENDASVSKAPFLLKAVKKTAILFVVIILPFYYFLTIFALIPCFVIGLFKGGLFEQSIDRESWNILFQHWGKYPNSFLIKAIELYYFRKESVEQPSFEIGVYRGETSKAVFFQKQLRAGMEFVPHHLLHYAVDSTSIHENLLCGDIFNIPFTDNTFKSVFTIHSMDDIQREAAVAVQELSRIIKPGGKLVFSSYSGYFGDQNILLQILRALRLRRLEKMIFELIYIGTNNIYDQKAWCDLLKCHGLTVERYVHFIPMWVAWLIDIPFRLEGYLMNLFNFHNSFSFFFHGSTTMKIYQFFLMKILCGIWATSFDRDGMEKPGMNIFVVARKRSLGKVNESPSEGDFRFKDKLQCPACKNQIASNSENYNFKTDSQLICSHCKVRYPMVGDIAFLLRNIS